MFPQIVFFFHIIESYNGCMTNKLNLNKQQISMKNHVFNDFLHLNNKRSGERTNFHYPKHHTGLTIFAEKIRFHGSPDGFTTEHTERKHKDVKDVYQKGNKNN